MAQAIQDNPEIGAVLQGYQQGDYDGLLNSQAALQALADSTGVSVDVIITRITQELRAKGATDGQLVAIDGDISNREDVIKTTAHELDHVRGGSSETLANLAGIAADLNVSASMDANQDEIDRYKPALGDGKDTATQLENEQLLGQNDETLKDKLTDNPDSFDYDATYRCTGPGWTNCGNAQDRALINEAKRLFPNSAADQEAYKEGKGSAFGTSVVNAGKGLVEIARDPRSTITNSFRGMINVLTNPNKAGREMRSAIIQWKNDYNKALKDNPKLAGQMRGELEEAVGFGVATTVIGGTSANALKAIQQTGKLKAVEQKKVDAQRIENNQNTDLSNVYVYTTPLKVQDAKFDYFFGRVDSNKHNLDRSLQNKSQLNSVGIFDNKQGREVLLDSLNKGLERQGNVIDRRSTNYDGKVQNFEKREILLIGLRGIRMMEVDFEVMPNQTRRVSTIIVIGGR